MNRSYEDIVRIPFDWPGLRGEPLGATSPQCLHVTLGGQTHPGMEFFYLVWGGLGLGGALAAVVGGT